MTNPFLDIVQGKQANRPAVWFMRQAGRVLPRYQELRQSHSFLELMTQSELAAKVTLLPVEDLGVDAAILFSDILVIPMAMQSDVEWTDKGPVFPTPLAFIEKPSTLLKPQPEKLEFVYRAIDRIMEPRTQGTPLIGFCGAPLTTLCYMLQGLNSHTGFPDAIKFFYTQPEETRKLIDVITELCIHYARQQVRHGIDVFQIFETHAGLVPTELYADLFLPAVKRISEAIRSMGRRVIFFPKGIGTSLSLITPDICDIVSIDWQTSLETARRLLHPSIGLQGNLDPRLLYADLDTIQAVLGTYEKFFEKHGAWIFNLGHGVLADTPFENLKYVATWAKALSAHQ
ncbi:putative uroporphyrinogen decarboxylase [Prevotella sp. DNF00663]|uniref:uroporphyrinogen decarboxylase n=1 Tax=unclassified Prevotella TaxID=2638335 RepID=UPI0005147AE7|nr:MULTISPECIES: uroporphyrinogen decarboxylase [unclassified Prevotella]KGI60294.1 uroporphyrinogen decarboxylase [Prevotella sp. S7 MS 2]KXB82822.1 putative uroporphyrinogen decarboxylase [Prevotella sp. DNF00663]